MGQKIGYARVSTTGQSLDIQLNKLKDCDKIYKEKISASPKLNRYELNKALDYIREGDVFIVTKLDRLARSVSDLVSITNILEEKNVDLIVLDQRIDTTTPAGRLTFNILACIGEFERELIKERAQEGRVRAKERGIKFGAKPKLSQKEISAMILEFNDSKISKKELAKKYHISRSSLYRITAKN
ncbi:MAG: recombinase family protein [Desulfobacterales bacterium]|nr:recombinase family protein [Desulfobacterales bacterium]